MNEIIKSFILGGSFVAVISYISTQVNPVLGGLLAGVPIGLPTIYFIVCHKKSQVFILNLIYSTLILSTVTIVFYLMYQRANISKNISLSSSMLLWLVIVITIWKLRTKK